MQIPTAVDEVHTTPESADEGPDTPNLPLKESTIGNEVSPIVLGYPEKERERERKEKIQKQEKNMFILDDLSELNSFNRWLLGLKPNNGGHVPVILKKSKKDKEERKGHDAARRNRTICAKIRQVDFRIFGYNPKKSTPL